MTYLSHCRIFKDLCGFSIVSLLLSGAWLFATSWTTACQALLSSTLSRNLPKLMFTVLVTLTNHLVLCHHILVLPSMLPNIRIFCNELSLPIKWPKYLSFSFSICPYKEHSGFISFKVFSIEKQLSVLNCTLHNWNLRMCGDFIKTEVCHLLVMPGITTTTHERIIITGSLSAGYLATYHNENLSSSFHCQGSMKTHA